MKKDNKDIKEIKTLFIIIVIIIALVIGVYFLTEASLEKKKKSEEVPVEINYSEILVGSTFDMPEDKYYVLAYKFDSEDAIQYENLYDEYEDEDDSLSIYKIDLSKGFNSKVLSEESNKEPTDSNSLKINESALILIENGKVTKYIETLENIKDALN